MIKNEFAILMATLLTISMQSDVLAQESSSSGGIALEVLDLGGGKHVSFADFAVESFTLRVLTPLVSPEGKAVTANGRDRAAQGLFLADYAQRYRTVAVSSGGYIESFSPPTPLGFVKSRGIIISRSHESWLTDGVICSDDGRISIDAAGRTPDNSQFQDCLQAGPLLLKQGKVDPLGSSNSSGYQKLARSIQEQTFVCINDRKRVLLGVTDKIDIITLLTFLRRPTISCSDALRLTGLDTSGMRVGDKLLNKDDYLFPTALGIVPRRR